MGREQRKDELAALLQQTGKAHHEAFAATGGADPDWAIWYAEHLHDRLKPFLATEITRSRIVCCLESIAEDHQAIDPDAPWTEFYAARILECLARTMHEAPAAKPYLLEISGVLAIRDLDVLSSTPAAPNRCGARHFQHLRLLASVLHA